jgi:hypothetical protein
MLLAAATAEPCIGAACRVGPQLVLQHAARLLLLLSPLCLCVVLTVCRWCSSTSRARRTAEPAEEADCAAGHIHTQTQWPQQQCRHAAERQQCCWWRRAVSGGGRWQPGHAACCSTLPEWHGAKFQPPSNTWQRQQCGLMGGEHVSLAKASS